MRTSRELEQRIYNELKQISANYFYIESMLDTQYKRSAKYTGALAILSGGGGLTGLLNLLSGTSYFFIGSVILSTLAALAVIINQFTSLFIISYTDMTSLSKLHVIFSKCMDELHNLLSKARNDVIDEDEASNKLMDINERYAIFKIEASRIFGSMNDKEKEDAANRSDDYLNDIYND